MTILAILLLYIKVKEDMTKDTTDTMTYLLKSCLYTSIATEGFRINTLQTEPYLIKSTNK